MAFEPIVIEQALILLRELFVARQIVDGCRKTIAAHAPGHSTGQIQCVLQTGRQRFIGFRVADVNVFPVRVRQHGMEQLVVELLSGNRDLQAVQVHEVEGHHIARMMNLRKDDFLANIVIQLPSLNATFQGSPQGVGNDLLCWFAAWRIVFLL